MSILSKRTESLAKTTIKNAQSTAKSARHDASKQAHDLRSAASNVAEIAKEDLVEFAHEAGARVRGFISDYSEEAVNASENLSKSIRKKPLQSALIALGAGFVIGLIARR